MPNNSVSVQKAQDSAPNVDKGRLLKMSYDEKLIYLDKLRIYYPKMTQVLQKIDECQQSIKHFDRPKCLSIFGESGCGKTTFYQVHASNYPDIESAEGMEKPVLYSRIPCPARIGGLPAKLLCDLGDPFYNKRSNIILQTQRLYSLIKQCKVKIIFLDEVQHLVDRNSEKLLRDSSDWFKDLIDAVRIPIVFLGMPDSRKIFIENEQLANRVRLYEDITPFKYEDETFRKLLYLFDISLPLKDYSGLAEPDTSKRLFLATKGLMKHMRDLIIESTILALQNSSSRITMPILAKAYNHILYNNFDKNPFLPGFELNKEINKYLNTRTY